MIQKLLRRIFLLDQVVDERSRDHNRRSTSIAAVGGAVAVLLLLEYRLLVEHRISWDLVLVIYAMAITKVVLLIWYRFNN